LQGQQLAEGIRLLREMEWLHAPIIYHPGGWDQSVPAEIKAQVPRARLELLLRGESDQVTDAEVIC